MRFAIRGRVPVFAAVIVVTVASVFLSNRAAGQDAAKAKTDTPPAAEAAPADAAAAPAADKGEGNPQALLDKGEAELKAAATATKSAEAQDHYAAAGVAFKAAVSATAQLSPADGQVLQNKAFTGLGRALVGMKDYTAAMDSFNNVIANTPDFAPALVARGQMKLDTNRADEALDDFQKAVQADPKNVEAQLGFGKVVVRLNRSDEAIDALTRAIEANKANGEGPDANKTNAEAYRLRGMAYSSRSKSKQAIEDLQQAIKLGEKDFESYFSLGVAYLRQEDYKAAVEQFNKAIEFQHENPKPGQEDQPFVQGYLTCAGAYIELGKATKNDPAAQQAAYQGAADEIQKLVRQLDEKNPEHVGYLAAALFTRGVAERQLGQLGPAIRTLTHAIELRTSAAPDDSTGPFLTDAYYRRGICFHLIGEDKMAISDFESAAHLDTSDPRANLWEGFTYAKLGDYQQALRAYGDAIAASDRFTPAYYNRGLAYMMMGNYKKAITDFNDAIRLEPANAEYYFKRGLAYRQLGDNQKASESFAAALEFDNKHAGAYRHMADAVQALGRTELATQYRQKADQLALPKKAK